MRDCRSLIRLLSGRTHYFYDQSVVLRQHERNFPQLSRKPGLISFNVRIRWSSAQSPARASSSMQPGKRRPTEELLAIPTANIRNWAVIAHIDHGKSTLSDRVLELTGTIDSREQHRQFLDKLKVEQQRGITVKAQSVSMLYKAQDDEQYLLNLIDTPGHVDFRSEVAQALAACEGCVLLVDASQGIQAQTVANFQLASAANLKIIPVINKIDLPTAQPGIVAEQLHEKFGFRSEECIPVSAKTGHNIKTVLDTVCREISAPHGVVDGKLRCILIDSWYDKYVGVVLLVCVIDGSLRRGNNIASSHTGRCYEVQKVGIMYPDCTPTSELRAGMVGFIICGMKKSSDAFIGDTYHRVGEQVAPLPGFKPVAPMVFVGAFPLDSSLYQKVNDSIERLTLNDRSIVVQKEQSAALGLGWRIGLAGTLHLSVFVDRLRDEHGGEIIITTPTVPYKIIYKEGTEKVVTSPRDFPDEWQRQSKVAQLLEPIVDATIAIPGEYLGDAMQLCEDSRGVQRDIEYINDMQVVVKYELPLLILVEDLFSRLKSITRGYASLEYEDAGYRAADLVKLVILVNKEPVDALCAVMHRTQAMQTGRKWAQKLQKLIDRQQFEIVIQAAIGNKIIARESIRAMKKDVTAKLYGGDWTRRMKLLEKQKKGKKQLQSIGAVQIDQKAFLKFYSEKE